MFGIGALLVTGSLAATFTDSDGEVHTWSKAKPTVMASTEVAKTLLHMGLPAEQLHSIYGGRYTYGSNFNKMDVSSAIGLDHSTRPYDASLWPTDYTNPEDPNTKALDAAVDMTPGCRVVGASGWCGWNDPWIAKLDESGWPDIIIYDIDISITIPAELLANATQQDIPILRISNDDYFWDASNTSGFGKPAGVKQAEYRVKDAWEMIHIWEDLSKALGTPNVDELMKTERKEFCEAAGRFKAAAKIAHDNGVRAMAGNLPAGTTSEDGKIGAYLTTPDFEPMLGLFESLGMPILHHDSVSYWEFMLDDDGTGIMSPTDLKSSGSLTGTPVPYNVDFWLIDNRNTLDVVSDEFAKHWPHPAIVHDQFDQWPVWNHLHSYQAVARQLDHIGKKLRNAKKVIEVDGPACIEMGAYHHHDYTLGTGDFTWQQYGMAREHIGAGQYACFKPVTFDWCDGLDAMPGETPASETPEDSAAHGTVLLAAVLLLREFF
jgi:hypothetical protein